MTRPVHFEILTKNPQEVAAFYKTVLGWSVDRWGEGEPLYLLLGTGPKEQPGIDGAIMEPSFPQQVINTMDVASLDETLAKVTAAGGKVVHGPSEIPGVGTHAYCSDPDGNLFGLMQAAAEM